MPSCMCRPDSSSATFRPAAASRHAAMPPPGPLPTTMTSNACPLMWVIVSHAAAPSFPDAHERAIDLRDFRDARHPHVEAEFRAQQFHDACDAALSECPKTPQIRPSDAHSGGAKSQSFEHIGAPPETAIDQHGDLPSGGLDAFRQSFDRAAYLIQLSCAVV